jgi:hypothetical protein
VGDEQEGNIWSISLACSWSENAARNVHRLQKHSTLTRNGTRACGNLFAIHRRSPADGHCHQPHSAALLDQIRMILNDRGGSTTNRSEPGNPDAYSFRVWMRADRIFADIPVNSFCRCVGRVFVLAQRCCSRGHGFSEKFLVHGP